MARLELGRTLPAIDGDPLMYWWTVCRGADVMQVFVATPEAEAWSVVHEHPVLLLPELVAAAEKLLGETREIRGLRQMHASLRASPHFAAFHRRLAVTLAGESSGLQRANLERALLVVDEIRRAGASEPADDELEAALRAQLAGIAPPRRFPEGTLEAAPDHTWMRLFLEEVELPAYHRTGDRRHAAARPDDRLFATHGGLASGACEWIGDDTAAVCRIVDTRWLFPSTRAAKAYLDSLAITGLESDGLPKVATPAVGDGAYAWGGIAPGRLSATRVQVSIFRIGRVVAKLHVTEGPKAASVFQVLAPSMLLPFAALVVRRVKWALAQYWLGVARGTEAATTFCATPARSAEKQAMKLFVAHPILLLPEFPTALATFAGGDSRAAAERLAELQRKIKSTNWSGYREVLRLLVRELLDEPGGEPIVNADVALGLVVDHRRADNDYSWAALETEARARC